MFLSSCTNVSLKFLFINVIYLGGTFFLPSSYILNYYILYKVRVKRAWNVLGKIYIILNLRIHQMQFPRLTSYCA